MAARVASGHVKKGTDIYVIIINWNHWKETIKSVDSVLGTKGKKIRIVLIDNGSSNDSAVRLKKYFSESFVGKRAIKSVANYIFAGQEVKGFAENYNGNIFIRCEKNYGFTGGCNLGIQCALEQGTKDVFLLNNDATVAQDSLKNLSQVKLRSGSKIVGARILNVTSRKISFSKFRWPQFLFRFLFKQNNISEEEGKKEYWKTDSVDGSAMLIDALFLRNRLGDCGYYFDPAFFMYCEETDLCLYAKNKKVSCVIARDVVVNHLTGKSSEGSLRVFYYVNRNTIRLARRWLSTPLFCFYLLYHSFLLFAIYIRRFLIDGNKVWPTVRIILEAHFDALRGRYGQWEKH